MGGKGDKYGFSFSWKRALGISGMKSRISRKIGIPLTRSGRERKIGRLVTGGCCCMRIAVLLVLGVGVALLLR